MRAKRSAVRERARAACEIDLQQHVHQLPKRRGPLHVVVLAFVDAPGLRAVAGGVGELRDVVAVAERHLAEYGFGLRRKTPRRNVALRAVVQHGAAQLADVPVEGIAVVAHVRVFNVEAAVLHDLRVGARVEIALGVVEHAQGEMDDGERIRTREARMAVEDGRRDRHLAERLPSSRLPRRREAGVRASPGGASGKQPRHHAQAEQAF